MQVHRYLDTDFCFHRLSCKIFIHSRLHSSTTFTHNSWITSTISILTDIMRFFPQCLACLSFGTAFAAPSSTKPNPNSEYELDISLLKREPAPELPPQETLMTVGFRSVTPVRYDFYGHILQSQHSIFNRKKEWDITQMKCSSSIQIWSMRIRGTN